MKLIFTKESKLSCMLAKSALVSVLAFSVGTGSVFASEITTTTPSSNPASISVTQNTAVSSQEGTASNESKTEAPDLLPGNFFYFVKTIYENIRLALTINDVKEAKLLTAFAQERLAEANAFIAQGKTEEAKRSLQKSLETQQSAVLKADQSTGTSTTVTSNQAEESTPKVTGTTTVQPAVSGQTTDPTQSEVEEGVTPVKEVKNPEQVLKVKADLQHNIVALASALEKVKNPKAQLALMKNIEKSFAHLDKKLSKIESKAKLEQTDATITALEKQTPEASPVPTSVPTSVPALAPIEPALVQLEQAISTVEKADLTKKSEDKPNTNKSDKARDGKIDKHSNAGGKGNGNGNGQDRNKPSKQE